MANRKIRLKLRLVLYKNGEEVLSTTFRKKSSLKAVVKLYSWDKAYLKVSYPLGQEYFNHGSYCSEEGLLKALQAFTEKDLVSSLS